MKFGYIIDGMTYLKYYMPLVEEASSKGIESFFIVYKCGKYNCPYSGKNFSYLQKICQDYNVNLVENLSTDIAKSLDFVFTVEGTKASLFDTRKLISLCCSTDFTATYENYINNVHHVIMSSKFVASYYQKLSSKNLYLGTPKFDVNLNFDSIIEKYNLNLIDKYVTIFYPRLRDHDKSSLKKIITDLRSFGYKIIIKTRGKDPVTPLDVKLSDICLEDISWHPHTSLELIKISDFIINFSSSVIEETTFLHKPMINFHIKPFVKPFNFLYDFSFVENMQVDYHIKDLKNSIDRLNNENTKSAFEEANKKLLDTKTSSSNIVSLLT